MDKASAKSEPINRSWKSPHHSIIIFSSQRVWIFNYIPTHICWYVYQNVPRLVQQGVYAHALSLSAVHVSMCPGRLISH